MQATLRGMLRAAQSVLAEQSLLPLLAISAPSHMVLCVLLSVRPCATVCPHATQELLMHDEHVSFNEGIRVRSSGARLTTAMSTK